MEVKGWRGRKGWQQPSLKMCCFAVTWRRPHRQPPHPFRLITHLSLRYTARSRGCCRDGATDRRRGTEVLNISIWLRQFSTIRLLYSFSRRAYCYSGTLLIKFKSLLWFPLPLSVREQSLNNRLTPFLQPATHFPPPQPTAQVLQGHTLIVYA